MRITLLAAGFVIGECCQLIAIQVDCWVQIVHLVCMSQTSRRLQQQLLSARPNFCPAHTAVSITPLPHLVPTPAHSSVILGTHMAS